MVREIRESVDSVVALIDEIEWIRAQTQLVRERNTDHAAAEEIREAGGTLEAELIELEMRLFDLRLTGGTARQDILPLGEAALRPPHEPRRLHHRNRRSTYGSVTGGFRNAPE